MSDERSWLLLDGESQSAKPGDSETSEVASFFFKCLSHLFLDEDRQAQTSALRGKIETLRQRLAELNAHVESMRAMVRDVQELKTAFGSLKAAGLIEKEPDSLDKEIPSTYEIKVSPPLEVTLNDAISVRDPKLALSLAGQWLFGKRHAVRKRMKQDGVASSQVRYWSALLRKYVDAVGMMADDVNKPPEANVLFLDYDSDFDEVGKTLSELVSSNETVHADWSALLDRAETQLRTALFGPLLERRISEHELLQMAPAKYAREMSSVAQALRDPLVPVAAGDDLSGTTDIEDTRAQAVLSNYDLLVNSDILAFTRSALAGGNLDRAGFYCCERAELSGYLFDKAGALGPQIVAHENPSLPKAKAPEGDVLAGLSIARRTAKEVLKLRAFVESVLSEQKAEISKFTEGMRPSLNAKGDVSGLQGALSSMQRDLRHLAKSIDDRISSTAKAEVVKGFLIVIDDLARIRDHADPGFAGGLRESLDMVLTKLDGILVRQGLQRIVSVGEQFDPRHHDCIGTEKREGCPQGVVLKEVSFGYMLGDQLLRPAKVIVCD